LAADAVMVGSTIIRRENGADNDRRVGGTAANPTRSGTQQQGWPFDRLQVGVGA